MSTQFKLTPFLIQTLLFHSFNLLKNISTFFFFSRKMGRGDCRKNPEWNAVVTSCFSVKKFLSVTERNQFDLNIIPKIFLEPNFNLNNLETFNAVYPHLANTTPVLPSTQGSLASASGTSISSPETKSQSNSAKLLQEKVSLLYLCVLRMCHYFCFERVNLANIWLKQQQIIYVRWFETSL